MSYLPLSHVAAQILDIYSRCYSGASVAFADKNALYDFIGKTQVDDEGLFYICRGVRSMLKL